MDLSKVKRNFDIFIIYDDDDDDDGDDDNDDKMTFQYSRSHGPSSSSACPAGGHYARSHVSQVASPGPPPPVTSCLNPYSLLSPGLNNLGSSYLLQNLLIGQIQERSYIYPCFGVSE